MVAQIKDEFKNSVKVSDYDLAIMYCYGEEALKENRQVTVENEVITAWSVEGFDNFQNLVNYYGKEVSFSIYHSGM